MGQNTKQLCISECLSIAAEGDIYFTGPCETPVTIDMVGTSTVDKVGKKTILLKTTGHEKCRYTIALACIVDGQKLSTGQPTESIGDASAHTPGHLQGLGAVPGDL